MFIDSPASLLRFRDVAEYEKQTQTLSLCVSFYRQMRLQRLWMQLQSRLLCHCARRTAMLCLLLGRLGLFSPTSLTQQCPQRSRSPYGRCLFTVPSRGRQNSPLCATLNITVSQHYPWDWGPFLPPPHPHATRRVWNTATLDLLHSLRQWDRVERWCSKRAKFHWMAP